MQKHLKKLIPAFLKPLILRIYFLPLDIIDKLKGKNDMIPPRSKIFIGAGDFTQIGEEFKKYFIELGNLQPDHRVLDVGCGIGRIAIPLTEYLTPNGQYWGFDIVKDGIDWCNKKVSSKYPNFNFLHSDIYNKHYNPKGKITAQHYRFPFQDEYFDFCCLTSVFTHMLPDELENYLSEINRVLRPNGTAFFTFFLLNQESEDKIKKGLSSLDFRYQYDNYKTVNPSDHETAVAFPENYIKGLFEKNNFQIVSPIQYGSWCNRDQFLSYQDIMIVRKENGGKKSLHI